jgi:hypothetical protein
MLVFNKNKILEAKGLYIKNGIATPMQCQSCLMKKWHRQVDVQQSADKSAHSKKIISK